MNVDEFTRSRASDWDELRRLVDSAGRTAHGLGPQNVLRLGDLYRSAVADLALARRAYPGSPFLTGLERLVQRARALVYGRPISTASTRRWFTRGYWQQVRERPALLLVAFVSLIGPMLLCGYWAWRDPDSARGLVPEQFAEITEPRESWQGEEFSIDEQAAFSSFVFTNNIRVTALAFAAGMFLGLGTMFFLVYNGTIIGIVGGLSIQAGNGDILFRFVSGHGVLELSCIIVGGAAGMRLGWALVAPGYESRGAAVRREARPAIQVLLGTFLALVVAGLIEGFVSPRNLELAVVVTLGFTVGVFYWVGVFLLGRPERVAPSRPEVPIVTGALST